VQDKKPAEVFNLKKCKSCHAEKTKIDIENFQFLDVMLAGLERLG
jgi:hypothetical protein